MANNAAAAVESTTLTVLGVYPEAGSVFVRASKEDELGFMVDMIDPTSGVVIVGFLRANTDKFTTGQQITLPQSKSISAKKRTYEAADGSEKEVTDLTIG